jgi:hypothetical protein
VPPQNIDGDLHNPEILHKPGTTWSSLCGLGGEYTDNGGTMNMFFVFLLRHSCIPIGHKTRLVALSVSRWALRRQVV